MLPTIIPNPTTQRLLTLMRLMMRRLLPMTAKQLTAAHPVNSHFSMFPAPSGTPMASLFVYSPDGSGDVICGTYTAETNTDEDGMNWTLLTVTDVYTAQDFEIGFAENDSDQVYILNAAGAVYEGQYLSADETVTYMGTAVALLS